MASAQVVLDTGRIYSLIGILRGTTTTGVTITGTLPGLPVNTERLTIQSDPTNGGNTLAYGDGDIATNGTTGIVLLAGDRDILQGFPAPTLNIYLSVSTNGTKVNLNWT